MGPELPPELSIVVPLYNEAESLPALVAAVQAERAIGASLYPNLPFNFLRDFTLVGGITREAIVMEIGRAHV